MAKTQYNNRLEQASIGKLMLELCTQTTFSIMLYNIYTITDTFYVSKGIGSIASGAIGIFSPFLLVVNGISSTLGTGGASIISRRMGEKNLSDGKKVVGCMIWIWVLCSLTITAVGLLCMEPLLRLLGCTSEIYPYAIQYGRIMLMGTIVSTGFSGIMQGIQPMLGFDWGRRETARVKKTISYAIYFGLVYGGIITICIYCGADQIVKVFLSDTGTMSTGKSALQIICFSMIIGGITPVIQAYFLALGHGKKVLALSLESIFIIRLPLLLLAGQTNSLNIVWWVLTLAEWLTTALAIYNYKMIRKE